MPTDLERWVAELENYKSDRKNEQIRRTILSGPTAIVIRRICPFVAAVCRNRSAVGVQLSIRELDRTS
jgi:hypothetical protein